MGCLCCKQGYGVEEEREPLLEGITVNISYTTVVVYNDSVTGCLLLGIQGHFEEFLCL